MNTALEVLICWLLADFLSGVVHWAERRYGKLGANELIDRFVVAPNLAHHRFPGGITRGSYTDTNGVSSMLVLCALAAYGLVGGRDWHTCLILLFLTHSNQVHKWAHTAHPPAIVKALQSVGLFQSVGQHARHHQSPYLTNYCVLSDWLNPALDRVGLWRLFELFVPRVGVSDG